MVMELVGGGELFDFIINNGALPEKEAAKVAAQVRTSLYAKTNLTEILGPQSRRIHALSRYSAP